MWSPNTYMGLVNKPETFLQLLLSPPQTLHLSNFFLEPSFPSQPALMHLPWTQTEVESGEQGVPSTTCTRVRKQAAAFPHATPQPPVEQPSNPGLPESIQQVLRRCWQDTVFPFALLCSQDF